jgi:uncharacterized protein involved in exopolysaccharide biosynthesis
MKEKTSEEFDFSSFKLIHYLFSKRKLLILVSVIAFVVSVIVSLLIIPRFRSTVILYPASSASVSQALISTSGGSGKNDILNFGEEEETEQLLQILNSDEIKEKLIEKYQLFDHYRIEPDDKYKYTHIYNKLEKNITFKKTEFMSVKISVLDEDPAIAANMVNDIAAFLDSTISRMKKTRAREAYAIVSTEYTKLQSDIMELKDSLKVIGEKGLYNISAQSKGLNEAYLEALSKGKKSLAEDLKKQIDVLGEYGSDYIYLTTFLGNESERLSLLKDKYTQAKVSLEENLPNAFIVSKGRKAEKKAYPKRSYIVILATFSAFLFALFLMILFDSIKRNA